MKKHQPYDAYPRGKEIRTFIKGSWREKEYAKPGGQRFYEPIPFADRLERTPLDQQSVEHIGELLVAGEAKQAEAAPPHVVADQELAVAG